MLLHCSGKNVATFNHKQESKTFDNDVMSDISEVENIVSEDSVDEASFLTVKSDSEDFTTESNKIESPVNDKEENVEATNTREDAIGSETTECGEREMPLQTPEVGGEVEDRGTGYNFGKKWTYLNGNHFCTHIFWC